MAETVSYLYDNSGALASVIDSGSGITTTYYYDFIDRLAKCAESGNGLSHEVEYAYDAKNNLTILEETINGILRTIRGQVGTRGRFCCPLTEAHPATHRIA